MRAWTLAGSAADCDGGNSAGFELVCVGEFAATTTSKIAAEPPSAPGTQFCKCSQSKRVRHERMLNSRSSKKLPPDGCGDCAPDSNLANRRFKDDLPNRRLGGAASLRVNSSLTTKLHSIPGDALYKIDHYVRCSRYRGPRSPKNRLVSSRSVLPTVGGSATEALTCTSGKCLAGRLRTWLPR